jgi:hypothetical protein
VTLASSLEHINRQSGDHDREGFFKACPTASNLTDLGWGR